MRHRDFYSLSMNSHTAQLAQLDEGGLVTLDNQGGSVCGQVLLDEGVATGQVFSPIHWSDQFSGSACISRLIPPVTDPVSGQPQSKYAQVTMAAVPVACWGMLFTRRKLPMPALPYWSSIAVEGGYLTLLAVDDIGDAVPAARAKLHTLLQQPGLDHLEYVDSADTDYRDMGWHSGQLQYALFLRSQRRALPQQSWLASLGGALSDTAPAALLAGMDPSGEDAGRMICSCWEVGEKTIAAAVQAGAGTVEDLGKTLRCGTQCGSCVPELRQFLLAGRKECAA
jgi:assimilatory nitrate reductase catalytic subunit